MGCRWLSYGIAVGMAGGLLGAIAPAVQASGRIIDIQGEGASIQRQGELRRDRAWQGTVMQLGDLLWPTNGTAVTVQCRNRDGSFSHGTRTRVFGIVDVCPDVVARYTQEGRGEGDFALFLANRFVYASQVVEDNPRLRWNPVEGVATYQVQVWDCGRSVFNCTSVVWEDRVEGTEVRYGGEALEPGRNYELGVSEGDGDASAFSQTRLRRLEAEQATAVWDAAARLDEADLSAEAKALALADRYLAIAEPGTLPPEGAGLVLVAIAELETVAAMSETPYVHRLLGDLYLQVGLLEAAQVAYEQTVSLTEAREDLANRAAAQVGLANIAVVWGNAAVAELRLLQARVSYTFGGDGARLTQVQGWLDRLREQSFDG